MTKAAFNNNKNVVTSKFCLILRKKLVNCYISNMAMKMDTAEIRPEILGML